MSRWSFTRVFIYDTNSLTGQYRELGVLLWRGWGIDAAMAQCFGNEQDKSGKGRQMPVVYALFNHFFTTLTRVPHVALGFSRTSLPHDLIPTGHTDPPSCRSRLRASARSSAAGQELCRSLFWRRRSVRGRLPRGNAVFLCHRLPDPFHRP